MPTEADINTHKWYGSPLPEEALVPTPNPETKKNSEREEVSHEATKVELVKKSEELKKIRWEIQEKEEENLHTSEKIETAYPVTDTKPSKVTEVPIQLTELKTREKKVLQEIINIVNLIKEGHDKKIAAIIQKSDLTDIAKVVDIYESPVYNEIPENKKNEILKIIEKEEEERFAKLTPEEREKSKRLSTTEKDARVRLKILKEENVSSIFQDLWDYFNLSPEQRSARKNEFHSKLEKKMQEAGMNPALAKNFLDEEKMKTEITKEVQEKGILFSDIVDEESKTGKEILALVKEESNMLLENIGDDISLEDFPLIAQQYLLFNRDKLLADDVDLPPKITRELQVRMNQLNTREWETPEEHTQRVDHAFRSAWVTAGEVQKNVQNSIERWKMNPFLKLIADLFAPLWAMMPWEVWDFWRNYLQSDLGQEAWSGGGGRGNSNPEAIWGPEGKKIEYSWSHDKAVKDYIAGAKDPAYTGQINEMVNQIKSNEVRYKEVSEALAKKGKNIPWQAIGAIHHREASFDFNTCLHNGDPLGKKTTHVPAWLWPFNTWESAAIDALSRETYIEGMDVNSVEGLAKIAEFCERYNGLWYRKKWRTSPYVWAGASFYSGGQYVSDGKFSSSTKDKRPGTMPAIIALSEQSSGFSWFQESTEVTTENSWVKWFQDNAGKTYGGKEGQFDCMTSTHAALGVSGGSLGSKEFRDSSILRDGKETDLWNISTAAAMYSGVLTSASTQKRIKMDDTGYYGGERAQNPGNLEYYIEENVMKRTQDSPDGMVDAGGKGKLIHYSKEKKWIENIVTDIKTRLPSGESAMMWSTGNGTNAGGHEWLIHNENGTLKVYESTNFEGKGVSGKGVELWEYLNHKRRSKYQKEALIFAKKA